MHPAQLRYSSVEYPQYAPSSRLAGRAPDRSRCDAHFVHGLPELLGDEASDEAYGFHVQQAAEKALKAWIALLGETYPLVHSIEALAEIVIRRGEEVNRFRTLFDYTPYAVEFRYEGIDPAAEPIDRREALSQVKDLVRRVRAMAGGPRESTP